MDNINLVLDETGKPTLFTRLCAIVYISQYGFNNLDIIASLSNITNETEFDVMQELVKMKELGFVKFELNQKVKTDD